MHALLYTVILIIFLLHVEFSVNLKIFSDFSGYICAFFNHKLLTFLSFLIFLSTKFNNNPYSTCVNSFYIVSFDVIKPLRGLCNKQGFTKFLTILPNCSVVILFQLISM